MDRKEFEERLAKNGLANVRWHGGDCTYSPIDENGADQVRPHTFGLRLGKSRRYEVFFSGNAGDAVVVCSCRSEDHAYQELYGRLKKMETLSPAQVELHRQVGESVEASEHSGSQLGMAVFEVAIVAVAGVLAWQQGETERTYFFYVVLVLVACVAYGVYLFLGWLNKSIVINKDGGTYRDNFGRVTQFTWNDVSRVSRNGNGGQHVALTIAGHEAKFYESRTMGYPALLAWLEKHGKLL